MSKELKNINRKPLRRKFALPALVAFIFLTALYTSCEKAEDYPETPSITFKSFIIKDSIDLLNPIKAGTLTFSFVDGDGDIGLRKSDTIPPTDTSKVYFTRYTKVNGVFIKDESDTISNFRLPYLVPQGQNKVVKGDIKIDLHYPIKNLPQDTFKYEFFIVDRSYHQSNIEETPEIFIKQD